MPPVRPFYPLSPGHSGGGGGGVVGGGVEAQSLIVGPIGGGGGSVEARDRGSLIVLQNLLST